jgi:hypothetical protein
MHIARTIHGARCVFLAACLAACTEEDPPPAVQELMVLPASATTGPGGVVEFDASIGGSSVEVTWSVLEGAAGGTVTETGTYTAPASPGTFHVVATGVADPSKSGDAVVTVESGYVSDLPGQLSLLSGVGIYFGHQSVGTNIMDGVRTLLSSNTGAEPSVVTTSSAASMGTGIWAEASNGSNFDPISKITAFQSTIGGGVGAAVDVAFMKFCWVDFDDAAAYWGTGSVDALFDQYRSTMAALKLAHPSVTFVHFTSPLYTDTARNVRREQYNDLVRLEYAGTEPVFDLALIESTRPEGTREIGTYGPALVPAYTSDGGHLNATGQDLVARELVELLANLP